MGSLLIHSMIDFLSILFINKLYRISLFLERPYKSGVSVNKNKSRALLGATGKELNSVPVTTLFKLSIEDVLNIVKDTDADVLSEDA